ncbi:MAG TPA: low molecular weight phosphatase family protein [Naasia sp.]
MTVASFPVLIVCTGNLCRSPLAEQLLRAHVGEDEYLSFSSAGTRARSGDPMPEEDAVLSTRYGGDPSGHASRPISPDLVRDAGLVLTASREHRADVVALHPRAARYTFTLRQFARLVDAAAQGLPERIAGPEFVAAAAAQRGYSPPHLPEDDDIPDPYRRPQGEHERAARLISEAVERIAPAMRKVGAA